MLEVGVAAVELGAVDAVLGADHLPEGTTPLQSAAEVREGRGAREAERVRGWRDRRGGCAASASGREGGDGG
jgi:hypothetical protein